jgi:hypothetical protein
MMPASDAREMRFMRWLPWLAALVPLAALAASWQLPLLEAHGFRQTQTAISSYWMADGQWLAYPTPVLGAPWSIPFELPLFQLIVLGVANVLPINLDQAGRLVSSLFLLATAWPLRRALRLALPGRERLPELGATLMLLSPLLVFWSRAFMIESTAVFFAVAFIALALETWERPRPLAIIALLLAAVLAALVKITTFFGFGIAAALLLAPRAFQAWRSEGLRHALQRCLPAAAAVGLALVATVAWVRFGDGLKAQTLWGWMLGSENLHGWNFGNWTQKTDPAFWRGVVFGRAARDILGSAWLLPVLLLALAAVGRGLRRFAAGALLCYLVPMATFTNLHLIHNYYQAANALFLVLIAACAVDALWQRWGPRAGAGALALVALVMLAGFRHDFLPLLDPAAINLRTPTLAAYARAHTKPDEVLLGIGLEWNSEVPYYATRRAMLLIDSTPVEAIQRMRTEPRRWLGEYPLGMVIVCKNQLVDRLDAAADMKALLADTTKGRTRKRVADCDVYR